jgi:hypothetical protein
MQTMIRQLEGATFIGPLTAPAGAYLYRFTRGAAETVVGWSLSPGVRAVLPQPALAVISRDGEALQIPDGAEIELGPSPVYYRIR